MRTTTRNAFAEGGGTRRLFSFLSLIASRAFPLLLLTLLISCTSQQKQEQQTSEETTVTNPALPLDTSVSHAPSVSPAVGDELQLPSVPDVSSRTTTSTQARKLPEEDEMDVRTPVQLRFIASSETTVRGVRLYITEIDTEHAMTTVHAFVQNLWGKSTKIHPEPIAVNITEAQLIGAKLLDDQTGITHRTDPRLAGNAIDVTHSAQWSLAPGDRQTLVLTFPALPAVQPQPASRTATLIIPGFATVTQINLHP